MMKIAALVAISALAIACGGSNPPPASTTGATDPSAKPEGGHGGGHHDEGHHGDGHKDHHPELSPALHDFHGVLAPVWHSDPGALRVEKACTNAKALQEKATATNDAELATATKDLDAACAKTGKSDVEAKLKVVHERFHALAEQNTKH